MQLIFLVVPVMEMATFGRSVFSIIKASHWSFLYVKLTNQLNVSGKQTSWRSNYVERPWWRSYSSRLVSLLNAIDSKLVYLFKSKPNFWKLNSLRCTSETGKVATSSDDFTVSCRDILIKVLDKWTSSFPVHEFTYFMMNHKT